MLRVSDFLVKRSKIILILFICLAAVACFFMTKVTVNTDMSKYLPADSATKKGMAVMEDEFPVASSLNLMLEGLSDKQAALEAIAAIPHVSRVTYDETEKYNKDGYTLFIISLDAGAYSDETREAVSAVKALFEDAPMHLNGDAAGNTVMDILPMLISVALVILMLILFFMCSSWLEPLLFLFSIAIAVVLNMGTNIIFGSVSDITNSIAAVLQLCLSMDYSIMLLSRYQQEKEHSADKQSAMKKALGGAFVSISSSSITTIVGMLALVFMSFTIGRDIGLVLAKGVFFSLLCNFTVLPALILFFDRAIEKTAKKSLHLKMDKIASGSYKLRYAVPVIFVLLFVVSFFIKGNIGITYAMSDYYKVNEVFTLDNPVVVLYDKENDSQIAALAEKWENDPSVTVVDAYATSLGKALGYQEMAYLLGFDEMIAQQLYQGYAMMYGGTPDMKIAVYDFYTYMTDVVIKNPAYAAFITEEMRDGIEDATSQMESGRAQLVGENYGRVIINTSLPEESEETFAFIESLRQDLDSLSGQYYILGSSATASEMNDSFPSEMNRITILTVISIFVVVAVAFRSVFVPLILVCVMQCAVFITMGAAFVQGGSIYYLPLLIVQCLLLGATVDYGILLTSYYREARLKLPVKEALIWALNHSIHTILTSGLILTVVTGVLGIFIRSSDPAISEILVTIGVGGLTAMILVVFILPGLLAALDRLVVPKRNTT